MKTLYTAIIICNPPDPVSRNIALKYRKIDPTDQGIKKFMNFAAGFPTAQYVNFYDKATKQYIKRIYYNRDLWQKIRPHIQQTLNVHY